MNWITEGMRRNAFIIGIAFFAISCGHSANKTQIRDSGKKATADEDVAEPAPRDATMTSKDVKTENTVCERDVLAEDVTNARDIGGWPLAGGKQTACRRVMRGGTLVSLSDEGCEEFAKLAVRTVVDLREASVQASSPPPACVTEHATRVLAPMPKLLPDTPENYLALMDQGEAVRKTFAALGNATSYPVYIHCEIGRDRTNFLVALILLALGAEREAVVEEFELSAAAGVAVKTECIEAVLDEIERRGGIDAVLKAFGVAPSEIDVMRAQLIVE
jgi:hypothetical protein